MPHQAHDLLAGAGVLEFTRGNRPEGRLDGSSVPDGHWLRKAKSVHGGASDRAASGRIYRDRDQGGAAVACSSHHSIQQRKRPMIDIDNVTSVLDGPEARFDKQAAATKKALARNFGDYLDQVWIAAASGKIVYPYKPEACQIEIEDIATGLANQCAYAGQCMEFYSLAQHAVLTSRLCEQRGLDRRVQLAALLYQAPYAYVGMMAPSLMHFQASKLYQKAHQRLKAVIVRKYQLRFPWDAEMVKARDDITATETRDVLVNVPPGWKFQEFYGYSVLKQTIQPWGPGDAERRFKLRYMQLAAGLAAIDGEQAADNTPWVKDL